MNDDIHDTLDRHFGTRAVLLATFGLADFDHPQVLEHIAFRDYRAMYWYLDGDDDVRWGHTPDPATWGHDCYLTLYQPVTESLLVRDAYTLAQVDDFYSDSYSFVVLDNRRRVEPPTKGEG